MTPPWSPTSWKDRLGSHQVVYKDRSAVEAAVARLHELPPLVTSWEIERLRSLIAEAQEGRRFLLQGGDCAERIADCKPDIITAKLKILLQMSLVFVQALKRPVIRVGRFAGQYAKPRSSPTETRVVDGRQVTLPSYYGDLVNDFEFTPRAREPDPARMVEGYQHAATTLNFIRSLLYAGFGDLHHPEYWDLGFLQNAALPPDAKRAYERITGDLGAALRIMEAVGERTINELSRLEFFTSHEALNLHYESAQTRSVPRREGFYNLTTHLPWLGERTRDLEGAHVEYLRGIANPVGMKVGPAAASAPDELARLIQRLNPSNEPGKIVVITRFGASRVGDMLGPVVDRVAASGLRVLWVCDPMHGNTRSTSEGIKTRSMSDITAEVEASFEVLASRGIPLGGVHIELTGEDVTECLGGPAALTEKDLARNYSSPCDPRLNYEQALELSLLLARKMTG